MHVTIMLMVVQSYGFVILPESVCCQFPNLNKKKTPTVQSYMYIAYRKSFNLNLK